MDPIEGTCREMLMSDPLVRRSSRFLLETTENTFSSTQASVKTIYFEEDPKTAVSQAVVYLYEVILGADV